MDFLVAGFVFEVLVRKCLGQSIALPSPLHGRKYSNSLEIYTYMYKFLTLPTQDSKFEIRTHLSSYGHKDDIRSKQIRHRFLHRYL